MAITKAHPRLKAEVLVNGIRLKEYNDEDEQTAPNAVTKYIESQSGAEFAIRCILEKPWPGCSLMLDFYLDGKCVRGSYMMQKDFAGNVMERLIEGSNYSKDNKWYLQKFCFSELKTDDSDVRTVSDELMKDLKGMGEISIKAYRVKNLKQVQKGLNSKDLGNVGVVPEKALKGRALSHQSSFRPPVVSSVASTIWTHDYLDTNKDPFAVLNFKYRSRAALKSLLIVPRSPSPVPLENRNIETLGPEEMRELLRRQREREDAAHLVKHEIGVKRERSRERSSTINEADDDDDEVSFVSAKRRRLPVIIDEHGVEIIDLT